ncbi:hypothetical protein Hanom_Chr06g00552511 [Helianthus anomalus]
MLKQPVSPTPNHKQPVCNKPPHKLPMHIVQTTMHQKVTILHHVHHHRESVQRPTPNQSITTETK